MKMATTPRMLAQMAGLCCLTLFVSTCSGQTSEKSLQEMWKNADAIDTENVVVEINEQNEIAVDVAGTLSKISPAARGGLVRKGQVVVEIDSRQAKAELDELEHAAEADFEITFAKTAIEYAETTLQDWIDRNKSKESSIYGPEEIRKQELEVIKAKAGLKKAEHEKRSAELAAATKRVELKLYTKTAEITGIVTDLHKKAVGTSVRQGDPIMTIVNFETMVVKMDVDPRFESQIGVGDKVIVQRAMAQPGDRPATSGSPFVKGNNEDAATPTEPSAAHYFIGEVTFTGGQAKTDDKNSIMIEAVVKNRVSGERNYLLKEGVRVQAKIFPGTAR
ncbi:MAG: efflux RND transporter periplasmic adaptor subunit [Planctomycetaceae bacterium]|nr:efflux RND transporter periplasmic adaptor subunit [Planctomycetaceae bacterium]